MDEGRGSGVGPQDHKQPLEVENYQWPDALRVALFGTI